MNPKETFKKLIDAMNSHDPKAFATFYTRDATLWDPFYTEPLKGLSAIEKDFADFVRAFPDLKFEIRNLIVEGNIVAAEGIATGTNTGPMTTPNGETPATGKKMKMYFGGFDHIDSEGKIVEEHRYYNVASILKQLGITQ